jgi:dTDP-4-amino-4,6-dideoxygalactose transaminase
VFIDVQEDTYNLDSSRVAAALTPRTKAIIVVHLFGLCADMDGISSVLPKHVTIIEDAACAAGAAYKNKPAGSFGDFGCFSLHPRKSVTCGEGGVLTTNEDRLARVAEMYRNHGASISEEARHRGAKPYELPEFKVFGYNYRMTDIQAAIAAVQLQRLDGFIGERTALADRYDCQLGRFPWIKAPTRPPGYAHALQAYVALLDERRAPASRNEILAHLQAHQIAGRPGTHSIVGLEAYRNAYGTDPADFPIATRLEAQSIALPLHNHMNGADVDRVVAALETVEA